MILFVFMMIIGFVMGVIFLSNSDPAVFFFFRTGIVAPKVVILLLFFLSGVFLEKMWQSLQTISSRKIYREFSNKITRLEEELKEKDRLLAISREREGSGSFRADDAAREELNRTNPGERETHEP